MSGKLRPSQVWGVIVKEWDLEYIAPSDLSGAMEAMSRARAGLADEISPVCLFPIRLGEKAWSLPVTCGADACRGSHSIQEARPLKEIAAVGNKGLYVLGFFPSVGQLVSLTKGVAGRLGTKWLWDIAAIPPRPVVTGEASVAHFACSLHDSDIRYLGMADNLETPDLGGRVVFDDQDPPAGLDHFLHSLFMLAYRTLLLRVSQLRGVEKAAISALSEQSDADNRFAVRSCLDRLRELSDFLTDIGREKSSFDRRILGDASVLGLVHHVVEFFPTARYAASEFIPFEYRNGSKRKSIWSAVNVLPIEGQMWLIVSHHSTRNSDIVGISKEVVTWAARNRFDLDVFSNLTNVYASPVDFEALADADRSSVSSRMAWKLCEEPFEHGLELLRSSPSGRDLVERCERKLGGRLVPTAVVGAMRGSRRF